MSFCLFVFLSLYLALFLCFCLSVFLSLFLSFCLSIKCGLKQIILDWRLEVDAIHRYAHNRTHTYSIFLSLSLFLSFFTSFILIFSISLFLPFKVSKHLSPSFFLSFFFIPQVLYLIVNIKLMLSASLCPKVITLSGYCYQLVMKPKTM